MLTQRRERPHGQRRARPLKATGNAREIDVGMRVQNRVASVDGRMTDGDMSGVVAKVC